MKSLESIKWITPYFHPYRHILILDLICASLTTAAEIVLPIILRYLTNLGTKNVALITRDLLFSLALLYFVIKLVEIVASYFMTSLGHIMGARIETDMRSDLYTHLQTLSDSFYNETKVGQLMSRITNDLFDITEFAHHCPEEYFIGAIKILVTFIILLQINVPLTLLLYAIIPIMFFAAGAYRKKMRKAQFSQRKHIGDLNASIEDSLSGIRVVKSFANEEIEQEKFEDQNSTFLSIKKIYYRSMASFTTVTRIFDGLMYLLVIILGGYYMMTGAILPGDLVVYVMYVTTMIATVRRIVEFTEVFQKGVTGIERFHEIMEVESDIEEKDDAIELRDIDGNIAFNNVDFRYEEDQPYVLKDFNLVIDSGKSVAIVGPSGAGKTTVCNLIPRFYDVDSGSITVDGVDVRDVTLESLRRHIGIVQQDVYLFSGSVLENIRYGKPKASRKEVIEAAKLANAYDFIMELEDGFDTYVGEKGIKLSGGQKQRISIARVFLKNPPILILDEATSALDNRSEAIIQKSLEQLSKGRTTLSIAHRLTTIQNADVILVMDQDRGIVEKGDHEELMKEKGMYYNLYTKGGLVELSVG